MKIISNIQRTTSWFYNGRILLLEIVSIIKRGLLNTKNKPREVSKPFVNVTNSFLLLILQDGKTSSLNWRDSICSWRSRIILNARPLSLSSCLSRWGRWFKSWINWRSVWKRRLKNNNNQWLIWAITLWITLIRQETNRMLED